MFLIISECVRCQSEQWTVLTLTGDLWFCGAFLLKLKSMWETTSSQSGFVWKRIQLSERFWAISPLYLSFLVSSKCWCVSQGCCQRATELLSVRGMFNIPIVLEVLPSPVCVMARGGLWEKELRFSAGSQTDSIIVKLKWNLNPESASYSLPASSPASEPQLFGCSVAVW